MSTNTRQEFGIPRTPHCSCDKCVADCKKPGFIIPDDLDRMWKAAAPQMTRAEFVMTYLEAGNKAVLMNDEARLLEIPTIRPKTNAQGCVFLKDNRCSIHEVSPYGCAFFDCKIELFEWNRRVNLGLESIQSDIRNEGSYFHVLHGLLGVVQSNMILDITQRHYPAGVPMEFKEFAKMLHTKQVKTVQNENAAGES